MRFPPMLVVPPKNKTFSSRVEDNLFFDGLSFPWSQSGGLSLPGLSLPGISIPGLNIPGLSLPGTITESGGARDSRQRLRRGFSDDSAHLNILLHLRRRRPLNLQGIAVVFLGQLLVGRRRDPLAEELDDVEREAGHRGDGHGLPEEVERLDELRIWRGMQRKSITASPMCHRLRSSKNKNTNKLRSAFHCTSTVLKLTSSVS